MIEDSVAALAEIFSQPFRAVLLKVLALTAGLLLLAVIALNRLLISLVHLPYGWLQTTLSVVAGLTLLVGSIFLVTPISSLVAGFFIDELALRVEHDIDPLGTPGRPLPILQSVALAARFSAVTLFVMALVLVLLFVPGVNAVAFLGANAYLLGWQYFEFAALRFRPLPEANLLRRRHAATVFLAGLMIALFVAVPVLNLLTPLFGTALMVRVHKRVGGRPGLPRR